MWASAGYPDCPVDRELHSLHVSARRNRKQSTHIHNLEMKTKWCPAKAGWGVRLTIRALPKPANLSWFVEFCHYPQSKEHPDLRFHASDSVGRYGVTKEFDDTRYQVDVLIPQRLLLSEFAESPEVMRDAVIHQLNLLKAAVKNEVESGAAIKDAELIENRQATIHSIGNHAIASILASRRAGESQQLALAIPPPDDDRPQPPRPSNRKMSSKEKAQIIRECHATLEGKIELVTKHADEMHAALLQSFPVQAIVKLIDQR